MLACDDAPLGPRAALFTAFMRVLRAQLAHSLAPVRRRRQLAGAGHACTSVCVRSRQACGQDLCASVPTPPPATPLGPPQGQPVSAQAQPLGAPMVEELLGDSFLKKLSSQFFQMLHEERAAVAPDLAEQVGGWRGRGPACCRGGMRAAAACTRRRSQGRLPTSPCPLQHPPTPQAAAVSGVLQRSLGWGVQVVTALDGDSDEDEDGPVVVEGVELPPDA